MGNPAAAKFTAAEFNQFRLKRIKTVSPNTANHELAYFRAMFNELKRLGEWHPPNPLQGMRRLKMDEPELAYLEQAQILELLTALDEADSDAGTIARVCLATGARWGEAVKLKPSQIKNGRITFTGTKSGKNRAVPISQDLEAKILERLPFTDGMNTFKRTIAKLKLNLPKGQLSHILRHTFASHFMINGGNIITLQKILGHGSLAMTVRYAHLSPDHLSEVLDLNPIAKF